MQITPADMKAMIYDPARMQQLILSNTTPNVIRDATNPFVMLLEASVTAAAAASEEMIATFQRFYPSLAISETDIFQHISDKELVNVFSTPSETNLVLYLSVRDIKSNITRNPAGYYEVWVLADTTITVTGIPFTMLNTVNVKLYDTGSVFAEQLQSTNTLANNSLGVLPAGIVNFQDGEPWVAVETTVKQIRANTIVTPITTSEGFKLNVTHSDRYHFSEVFYRNSNNSNVWTPMKITHSNEMINPNIPTMYVSLSSTGVTYNLPDTYLISGMVSGEIKVILYETKGYLDLPIYNYQMSEYEVNLNTVTNDPAIAQSANVTTYANSRDILNGGYNGYSFAELKDSVIKNTLGNTTLPITTNQLKAATGLYGFELFNVVDLITQRTFAASKNMVRHTSNLVYAKPDIYFNTVGVNVGQLNDNVNIINNTGYTVIPSGTVFKEVNGVTSIVTDTELNNLNNLNVADKVTYLQNNKMFYTPYYYLIDTSTTTPVDARVYDLDNPTLYNIRIVGKNTSLVERANIGQFGVFKTPNGYSIKMTVLGNAEFKAVANGLKGQLVIPLVGGSEVAYIQGTYDPMVEQLTFNINTNFNIDVNNNILLNSVISNISNTLTSLINTVTVYLYIENTNIVDNTNYLKNELNVPITPNTNVVVLDKETITLELGKVIDFIWNKTYITYTDRKFKRYASDKQLFYTKDVYKIDPATKSAITVITDPVTGNKTTSTTILHKIHDPVLDAAGNPVYEYRAGDIVLDANKLPVVDIVSGVVRNIDILMLEYEYMVANSTVYNNYRTTITDTLRGWLFSNLKDINSRVLENTQVLYRSYKTATPVEIHADGTNAMVPYLVKPNVAIYAKKTSYSPVELTNLKTEIGYILHKYLDMQNINMVDIKNEIMTQVDTNIVSVKITNIDVNTNSEAFYVVDPTRRLVSDKTLALNDSGELEVIYNTNLIIHYI